MIWSKTLIFQGWSDMQDQDKAVGEHNPFTKMGMINSGRFQPLSI